MRHAILGPGGVGGLIGAVLARGGEQVTLIARSEQHPRQLLLESKFGNFSAPVEVAARLSTPVDVLWVTVKATQFAAALERVTPAAQIGAVVPLLNGVDHVRVLRERFGAARVVPATIAVESERVAPGMIVHRSPFARFNVASSGRARLQAVVDLLAKFGFECRFVDDETTLLWSKLVFLAPVALSTTAADAPIGAVVAEPAQREQLHAAVREACAVAKALGAAVDADAVIATIESLPGQMRSSMQKDVSAGREPELDAIAGPILRGGVEKNIATPATRALVERVERITAEVR